MGWARLGRIIGTMQPISGAIIGQDELVRRCRKGDRSAQRVVFEQTSAAVYQFLLRFSGNSDDAFDLTQETYLKAFAAMATFDGRSSLKTWLIRIGLNQALQLQRRARAFRERLEHLSTRKTENSEPLMDLTCRIDVQDALGCLEPGDRAILLLRYHEGLDYAAIAESADIPQGTVASRLSRARQRIRAMLNGGYGREEKPASVHLMERQEHEPA